MPRYTRQIVVFLDILGIKNRLTHFEKQALEHSDASQSNYHESDELNQLLEAFRKSLKLIKEAECNSYVFSDNICIAVEYVGDGTEKPNLFVQIPMLIGQLTNHYAKKGYFLRGAVDAGWFLRYDDIAVGVPLARAYLLESKVAIFPRVLISDEFEKLLNDYRGKGKISEDLDSYPDRWIQGGIGLRYINPFSFIIRHEDKDSRIEFLRESSRMIEAQLKKRYKWKVKIKFIWLAEQFNSLLAQLIVNNDLEDSDLTFSPADIKLIQTFRIKTQIPLRWITNMYPVFAHGYRRIVS